MRTTVRIDSDLLQQLKARAHRENVSVTKVLNRALRVGLNTSEPGGTLRRPYREETTAMGAPRINLDKALSLAAELEDEEILRDLALRK